MKNFIILFTLSICITDIYAQNVGINTTPASPPTNTLDVNGTLRVRGGSPGAGKVLTSDVNGVGTWTTPAAPYPRITYDAILALRPILGDMAYDITHRCLRVYNGTKWVPTYRTPEDKTPELALFASAGNTAVYTGFNSAVVDGNSNIYVLGYFTGTTVLGTTTLTSAGVQDIFIAKYSSDGTVVWAVKAGGILTDFGLSIALDASNNVYVTGYYSGTATFGNTTKTSAGNEDIFTLKYSTAGVFQWVASSGGSGFDRGNSIKLDAADNVYVTGYYQGSVTFLGTSGSSIKSSVAGSRDIFVIKYNSAGALQWVQSAGGPLNDESNAIAVGKYAQLYITGVYSGTANFGSNLNKTSTGFGDIFIATLSDVWLSVESAGGSGNDTANGIAVDAFDDVYITGRIYGSTTATFGVSSITGRGFIAKYSFYGFGAWNWVKPLVSDIDIHGLAITTDTTNNVYVTGIYNGTATFPTGNKTSFGTDSNTFITKYDADGNFNWVQTIGSLRENRGFSIDVDASGNVYIAGFFGSATSFGNFSKTSVGNIDGYITKLR